jgi:hypothetical protein
MCSSAFPKKCVPLLGCLIPTRTPTGFGAPTGMGPGQEISPISISGLGWGFDFGDQGGDGEQSPTPPRPVAIPGGAHSGPPHTCFNYVFVLHLSHTRRCPTTVLHFAACLSPWCSPPPGRAGWRGPPRPPRTGWRGTWGSCDARPSSDPRSRSPSQRCTLADLLQPVV